MLLVTVPGTGISLLSVVLLVLLTTGGLRTILLLLLLKEPTLSTVEVEDVDEGDDDKTVFL